MHIAIVDLDTSYNTATTTMTSIFSNDGNNDNESNNSSDTRGSRHRAVPDEFNLLKT